jgi:regulator of protease activity HflC (stomatin/prohibitin superfamily)
LEWVQLPIVQFGALGVLLFVLGMVFNGKLIPTKLVARSTLDDVRADRDARIAQAEKDRDERVAEAERDAERAWALYEKERDAHHMTRQAHAEDIRATLLASTESSQIAAAALTELKRLQLEGPRHDP